MEKLFSMIPKKTKKYKEINNGWNKNPQEKYLLTDFEMRCYMGLGVSVWLIASICFVFSLIGFIQKDYSSTVGWLVATALFVSNGFTLFSMSNKKEKESNIEKLKYKEALINKASTVKRMEEVERVLKKTVYNDLIKKNIRTYKENKKDFIRTLNGLVYAIEFTESEINDIYLNSKLYEYNVNEIFEVETFFEVDAYKESEIIQTFLFNIKEQLRDIIDLISTEDEDDDNFTPLKLKVDEILSQLYDTGKIITSDDY